MMNVDDLESLEETLEILSDPVLMATIRAGQDDEEGAARSDLGALLAYRDL